MNTPNDDRAKNHASNVIIAFSGQTFNSVNESHQWLEKRIEQALHSYAQDYAQEQNRELVEALKHSMPILEGCNCLGSKGSKERYIITRHISELLSHQPTSGEDEK